MNDTKKLIFSIFDFTKHTYNEEGDSEKLLLNISGSEQVFPICAKDVIKEQFPIDQQRFTTPIRVHCSVHDNFPCDRSFNGSAQVDELLLQSIIK